MRIKKLPLTKIIAYILLALMTIVMIFPLAMILNLSFLDDISFLNNPMQLISKASFTLDNYKEVLERLDLIRRFANTIIMTAIACSISILISILAAYSISRRHFKLSKLFYGFIMTSMFFPGSLVATIILYDKVFHIYGSPISLILIWALGNLQMNIFMMVGFIKQLPKELDEAALIDGCGYFKYIIKIVLPLMLPIIATILVFNAVGCWNDFVGPMIYLKGNKYMTLSVGLYYFRGTYSSMWNQYSSAIVLISLPMIFLYSFMQKYIIEGMTSGALKG